MAIPDPANFKGAEKAAVKEWLKGRDKFMSGFCNDNGKPGQHEGTKPKGLKTCPFWEQCPCECHRSVDALFAMTGMERIEVPNPNYKPDMGDFVMPYVPVSDPTAVALSPDGAIGPDDDERAVDVAPVASVTPLAERRTETGRAARGGLEAQVWDACHNYPGEDAITPKQVGDWIAEKYKIPTPSSGAINAVWDRWTKLGFCEQGKKPNRFLNFVNSGSWEELARLKASTKREKRQTVSNQRRGIR
jgi:hypothetical protein